ncbi:MAG: tRNA lysidine(34) synthetase TilS [Saprospirales bacterium]|nr:tRNA lysidine(34) synthetase TilS [Saprospirales bacterium]
MGYLDLQQQLVAYIEQEKLCAFSDRILLSVSGGPDSVLLSHLLHQLGYQIGVAHCNYQLRGEAADAEEAFVRELARTMNAPFYSISFHTRREAEAQGKSIQEVARDLRYEWLENVRQQEGYDWIATGHHLHDSVETLLFNLAKGCGIRGLHGILPIQGKLIRPLLFTGKTQILDYLHANHLEYRQDLSNQELYYDRNKIRHGVVPVLQSINPDFGAAARRTMQHIREAELFFDYAIQEWKARVVQPTDHGLQISWAELLRSPAPPTLLYEILAPYGFRGVQFISLFRKEKLQPGKRWYSPSHCLVSDREVLLLEPLPEHVPGKIEIPLEMEEVSVPGGTLYLQELAAPPPDFPDSAWEAVLDARQIQFPLHLRKWQAGDSFRPLGMNGQRKKLQDFFSDLKLSVFDKEKVWILECSGQIAWIIGHRIDESFKLLPESTSCWHFRFEKD